MRHGGRALDAGQWKDPKFAGEKLPTLEEQLAQIPAGKRILIEQKAGVEIVPALTATLAKTHLKRSQLVIIDFKLASAKAAKAAMPDLKVLWLLNPPSKDPKKPSPDLDEAEIGVHAPARVVADGAAIHRPSHHPRR